jgi:Protein of unknown function (DUF1064)
MATSGWQHVKPSDVKIRRAISAKTSKYHAEKVTLDGITFASKAEAKRYIELRALQAAGKIFRLELQPRYRLCAWTNGEDVEVPELGHYIADFRYCNHAGCHCAWGCTVEDVKGFKTPLYRWKKKHVEAQYGITVREIR